MLLVCMLVGILHEHCSSWCCLVVLHQSPSDSLIANVLSGQQIRLRGKNMTENEHVKLGAYHTLEIEQQRPFSLYKQAWDLLDLERIKQACDPAASADLAAVLITVCCTSFYCHAFAPALAGAAETPVMLQPFGRLCVVVICQACQEPLGNQSLRFGCMQA